MKINNILITFLTAQFWCPFLDINAFPTAKQSSVPQASDVHLPDLLVGRIKPFLAGYEKRMKQRNVDCQIELFMVCAIQVVLLLISHAFELQLFGRGAS